MFRKNENDNQANFWISYADLMAGLLFVFILLIGAIVVKSTILKKALNEKETSLIQKQALLKEKNQDLAKDALVLSDNEKTLKVKSQEIENLKNMLLVANKKAASIQDKVIIIQNTLAKTNKVLKDEQTSLKAYKGKVIVLSNDLKASTDKLKISDEKLVTLLAASEGKKTKYDILVEKLQKQKEKIKSLTGIKLHVIAALKKALGSQIDIDKKTGSLRLASNILFDPGKAVLKEKAKIELKKAFKEYIGTLVSNDQIKPHLDKIIIEGHTDSDGNYLYNLRLSQNRALAVMRYFLSLDAQETQHIKPLMIASGRAYLDRIMKDGKEDKEASRRIEIKFRLKNEDAMQEIEKVLDAK